MQRHMYGAWRKLLHIGWRFYFVVALMLVAMFGLISQIGRLDSVYLAKTPVPGGIYTEGLVGEAKSINPILVSDSAAKSVEKLVFSGLTQTNHNGVIVPDLAKSWSVSKDFRTYTFVLRDDVKWHDGAAFSANDVLFTIGLIQNPDTHSPLLDNLKGVKVLSPDPHTVVLQLPSPYPSFLSSTTFGIVPQHILTSTEPARLQLSQFNSHPIGTGPFVYDFGKSSPLRVVLDKNSNFYGGSPKLDGVSFSLYASADKLTEGYSKKQIIGFAEPSADKIRTAMKLPDTTMHAVDQPAYIALFFNTKQPKLAEAGVRQNITMMLDRTKLAQAGRSSGALGVETLPILSFQRDFAYTSKNTSSPADAQSYLKQKFAGQPITLNLATRDTEEYLKVATELKTQLAKANITVNISSYSLDDLIQDHIRPRKFDLLLFGENTGANIDIYNFWHSSQAQDPGLNLSSYASPTADKALESMRLAQDPTNRQAKEQAFLTIWETDSPAAILYSPKYLYFQNDAVSGFSVKLLIAPEDRFYNISNWAVKSTMVKKTAQN